MKPALSLSGPRKDLIDRAWDFFASVKVAVVLILLIAVASIGGTLVEQEGQYSSWLPPGQYYPQRYGPIAGSLLYRLGLTRMYTAWWYLGLLVLLGISLVVCSLQRFLPLWRVVTRPPLSPPERYLRRLPWVQELPGEASDLPAVAAVLRTAGYRVVPQPGTLFADRGRWSRWGPYITHIGLLLILLAGVARAVPGWYFDAALWVPEGQTMLVPGTDWAVKNELFTAEYYPDGRPRAYATTAALFDGGREVVRQVISPNHPLTYKGISLLQASYDTKPATVELSLQERATGRAVGRVTLDLAQPRSEYAVGGYTLRVQDYLSDFALDGSRRPISRSDQPRNPAFYFEVVPPGETAGKRQWFFVSYPQIAAAGDAFQFAVADVGLRTSTGLRVHKDLGVPLVYAGGFVVVLGLMLTFYLSHRRFWVQADGGALLLAGESHRNAAFFRREAERLATAIAAALEG